MSTPLIRVLGTIGADIDGVPVQLTKARHREILGILVAARGATIGTSALIDELWEDAPDGAVGSLRTFIGELRKLLEPARAAHTPPTIIVTVGSGYALRVPPDAVDLWRAEDAIRVADAASAKDREALLTAALDEWRGAAFEEFGTRAWAQRETARIAELRSGAVELLAETRLQLGRAQDVIALLDAHVGAHPWRERAWRLLALALYRSERQADALAVLASARTALVDALGLDPGGQLAALERDILRHDPSLMLPGDEAGRDEASGDDATDGTSILIRTAALSASTGRRPQIESVAALLPVLAASGSVRVAAEQRMAAIATAEELGDPELTARVIGGFDVPGVWTRSDDPAQASSLVAAAERTVAALPGGASDRVRARLLATIAMETRGTAGRASEATEAERIARRLGDPSLLCFALSARFQQTFETTGLAAARARIGAEIIAVAVDAELPTFEIEGRLVRMQALCALDDIAAASAEADLVDDLARRFDRGLATVFTGWFRHTFTSGSMPAAGPEMAGFRIGLDDLARLTCAVRAGRDLPDGDFGPYERWVRPLLLARSGRTSEAQAALDHVPDPPRDLLSEAVWSIVGLASIDVGHHDAARRSTLALLPAAGERAAGSGVIDLGPIAPLLTDLAAVADVSGRDLPRMA